MIFFTLERFMAMICLFASVFATQEEPWLTDGQGEEMMELDENSLLSNIKIKSTEHTEIETNASFLDTVSDNNFVRRSAAIVVESNANNATPPTSTGDSKCEPKILDEEPVEPVISLGFSFKGYLLKVC